MRIKLIEAGWQAFNDVLCGVPFVDGISTRDVNQTESDRISSILRTETVDGEAVGIAARKTDMSKVSAEDLGFKHYGAIDHSAPVKDAAVNTAPKLVELVELVEPEPVPVVAPAQEDVLMVDDADDGDAAPEAAEPVAAQVEVATPVVSVEIEAKAKVWSEDELAAVADKQGIEGLREIGTPIGVKARSIREMIDGILSSQTK